MILSALREIKQNRSCPIHLIVRSVFHSIFSSEFRFPVFSRSSSFCWNSASLISPRAYRSRRMLIALSSSSLLKLMKYYFAKRTPRAITTVQKIKYIRHGQECCPPEALLCQQQAWRTIERMHPYHSFILIKPRLLVTFKIIQVITQPICSLVEAALLKQPCWGCLVSISNRFCFLKKPAWLAGLHDGLCWSALAACCRRCTYFI